MAGERRDRAPSVHHWEPENRRLPSMLHSVVGSVTHPGDHNMDTDPSEQPLTGRRLPFGLAILAFIITPCPLDYSSQIFFFLSWHVVFSFLFSSRYFLFLFCFSAMRHVRSYFLNRGARVEPCSGNMQSYHLTTREVPVRSSYTVHILSTSL